MSSEPAHLDPALNSSVDGACLAVNSFEGLLRYNANGELENACAESYEVSDDACTYTFTLKDGLKWSNGEPLTAKDFAYSILRAGSPELAADYAYLCEGVFAGFTYEEGIPADSVVASEDGKTLTIKLAAPCPYFATLMAFPTFFPVYEASVEATKSAEQPGGTWANDACDEFVSNGAFKLQSWNHDSDMTYVKNENYWDADTVSIETLNIMLTSDDATAYAAYQAGNLDFIDSVPNDEMKAAMESPEFHIIDQLGTYYCGFNYNSKIYDELGLDEDQATQFRKAIALLIDRQYICDTIGQTGQVPASTFVPAGCSDSNGGEFKNTDYYDAANYEANLAEAKEILASIGLMDSPDAEKVNKTVAFTYLTNDSEGNVKIAEALQSDLAQVGIDLTIDQQEWNVFLDTRKNGQFDFCREGWVMDYDDPVNMLEMWLTNSGNNDMQFGKDASKKLDWTKYDQLINDIKSETDLAKRAEKMHEAEDLLMSTWAVIPLYYYNDPYMVKSYVENVYGTALGNKYFYHATINAE
ncbi:MAG: peptide ABC transporter substrate-binding protein [Eubacteriales bacterium]|nr:peptide ABC transporter substrate-binding protein [Eubacteriales bacterium]